MAVVTASKALDLYESTEDVIGQEPLRKQLSVILDGQWRVAQGVDEPHAGGVLLGGMSGTGKTMTARMMCRHLGLPFAETDATRYAEVSYKGLQLPQMFIPLMRDAARMLDAEKATSVEVEKKEPEWAPKPEKGAADALFKRDDIDEIVERAQCGVVVLDEFDKWVQRINHVTGQKDTNIQSELLKLIEGSEEFVTATDDEVGVAFETHRVLIICAGAFVGLFQQVSDRLGISFDPKRSLMDENLWNAISPEDFERFGLLPELAGRLSRHLFTRPLSDVAMRQILTRPGGILDHYRRRYEAHGVRWELDDNSVTAIIGEAMHHRTGARALEHVAHKMLGGLPLFEASVADCAMAVRLATNQTKATLVVL